MTDFLLMGGYAPYVWSAYGITLIVLVVNIWAAYRRHAARVIVRDALTTAWQRAGEGRGK